MALMIREGALLIVDNKLALEPECCCNPTYPTCGDLPAATQVTVTAAVSGPTPACVSSSCASLGPLTSFVRTAGIFGIGSFNSNGKVFECTNPPNPFTQSCVSIGVTAACSVSTLTITPRFILESVCDNVADKIYTWTAIVMDTSDFQLGDVYSTSTGSITLDRGGSYKCWPATFGTFTVSWD